MSRSIVTIVLSTIALAGVLAAQTRPRAGARPPVRPGVSKAAVQMACAAELGVGVATQRRFCDVLVDRDPNGGVRLRIPAHRGPATLLFDLHNRHTWSDDAVGAGRAYARYTTSVAILTIDGKLLQRGVARADVRTRRDLFDRIGGGAGPGGVKAVAPTAPETILVTVPDRVTEIAIVGEKLVVEEIEGRQVYAAPGRPVAIVSNAWIEYRPAAARRRR